MLKLIQQIVLWLMLLPIIGNSETITYFIPDAQGSTVAKTNEKGEVIWRAERLPYGQNINLSNKQIDDSPLQYTGAPLDSYSGLTYLKARYYNADIGRFYATDPKWFDSNDIQTFGRYTYANNNPYRYTDPTGEAICGGVCVAVIIGFITKATISAGIDAGVQKVTTGEVNGEQVAISAVLGGVTTPGLKSALAVNTATAAAIDINNGKKPSFDTVREGVVSTLGGHYFGLKAKKANFVKKTDNSIKSLKKNPRAKNDPKGFHSKRASQKNRTLSQFFKDSSDAAGTGFSGNTDDLAGHLRDKIKLGNDRENDEDQR